MAEFTLEEKLAYYAEKKAYWERKLARLLSAKKKKHAESRIVYYTEKIAAHKS